MTNEERDANRRDFINRVTKQVFRLVETEARDHALIIGNKVEGEMIAYTLADHARRAVEDSMIFDFKHSV